jgi:hypothetical protein
MRYEFSTYEWMSSARVYPSLAARLEFTSYLVAPVVVALVVRDFGFLLRQ